MEYIGNKDILKRDKTAFLCSQRCPAGIVLKSYDWAKRQREDRACIVCGNQTHHAKSSSTKARKIISGMAL